MLREAMSPSERSLGESFFCGTHHLARKNPVNTCDLTETRLVVRGLVSLSRSCASVYNVEKPAVLR